MFLCTHIWILTTTSSPRWTFPATPQSLSQYPPRAPPAPHPQVVGRKRFTLFPPWEHFNLHLFPRPHPLWHKSQADFGSPDADAAPQYSHARPYVAELGPGDVLYVPPLWSHYVETLTPSVSLSTWSKAEGVETAMNFAYKHEHKFDSLSHPRGKMFALRLFLDMLAEAVFGEQASLRPDRSPSPAPALHMQRPTEALFHRLLRTRYAHVKLAFPPTLAFAPAEKEQEDPLSPSAPAHARAGHPQRALCGKVIPTAQHVYGDTSLDVIVVAEEFRRLRPETRDVLLLDYIEELAVAVVCRGVVIGGYECVGCVLGVYIVCVCGGLFIVTQRVGTNKHTAVRWARSGCTTSSDTAFWDRGIR